MAPFEAWLTLQGMKTLHLRTQRQWENAAELAGLAEDHPSVKRAYYPGLKDHPGHDVHRSQASGDGGMLAIEVGSFDEAQRFCACLKVFTLAENLGATESLATHPASMTHADLSPERRLKDGITDGLIRLSIGVEDSVDLLADMQQALDALRTSS